MPNCFFVEYLPHLDPIASSRLRTEDGYAYPSNEVGLGIISDRAAMERQVMR